MPVDFSQFHFIREAYLLLLIPAFILIYFAKQQSQKDSAWHKVISPHLLKFLITTEQKTKRSSFPTLLVTLLTTCLILAISGPSFRQQAVPVLASENAQVILVDLSLSMDANDIKPSRLERAKFKLIDLLKESKEGSIGLVVYAGDAFVISPLTSDANTIASLVPTLSTQIMPVLGSRPDLGMQKAIELLKNAKHNSGQIIWLTDGVEQDQINAIIEPIKDSGYQLSILAIGTKQGAPIPLPNGNGFLKDSGGSIVVPKLEEQHLRTITNSLDAGYITLTPDSTDIEYLVEHSDWQRENSDTELNQDQKISKWIDDGYWLIWLVVFLFIIRLFKAPVAGLMTITSILTSLTMLMALSPQPLYAAEQKLSQESSNSETESSETTTEISSEKSQLNQFWQDLWLTRDQQAQKAFNNGNYEQAANLYQSQDWLASANYKQGNFEQAANMFANNTTGNTQITERDLYNEATSLAKAQKLEQSLEKYNQLLEQNPEHEDGLFNKKIVEDLLNQQQQEQQNQDQQQQDQEQQNDQSQDSDSNNQQQQDQQNSEQEEQQQQQSEQQQQQQEQQKQEAEISEDERDKSEKDQALEHWLEKIPDDPGGLLRRKMYREYQRRGRQQKEKKLW